MSRFLFDEQPILANKTLARELGLNEALVLQQINYWIEINKKSGKNYYDKKYWTYNSIRTWQEQDFEYMSVDTVKRTFSKLEKSGYLISANYNQDTRDKTKWYTINYEKLEELYSKIRQEKLKNEQEILNKTGMPNALGQNAPMEKVEVHQVNKTGMPNALGQNAPMHWGKMHQPLPENTTKNTTLNIPSFHPSNCLNKQKDGGVEGNSKEIRLINFQKSASEKTYENYLDELRENVDYFYLDEKEKSYFDNILKILADVMILNDDDKVLINQSRIKAKIVKARYKELNYSDIKQLIEILENHNEKVRNIRSFILTIAYNVHVTQEAYYQNLVSYDMRN